MKMPKVLGKEPLVDAVFEVRFGGEPQLADIVPGVLFGQMDPKPIIQRLPAHEIPEQIRENDRNLTFAPILRLELKQFTISIGNRNVIIGCKLPYPKWPAFKEAILDITRRISEVGIAGSVERYSVKYVNLIEAPTIAKQIEKIAMSIHLGDFKVNNDHVSLKIHRKDGDILHLISVVTGAQAQLTNGKQVFGIVVDIDSIRNVEFPDFRTFVAELEPALETLRQANKEMFFGCLTETAIREMEPQYE